MKFSIYWQNNDIPAVGLAVLNGRFLSVDLHDHLGAIGFFDRAVADHELADQTLAGNGPFPTVFEAHFDGAGVVSVVPVGDVPKIVDFRTKWGAYSGGRTLI
jgi:hypothetical protein